MSDSADPANSAGSTGPADPPPPSDPKARFEQAAASKQANGDEPEDYLWEGSYSHKAMIGTWFGGAVATLVAVVIAAMTASATGWGYVLLGIVAAWVIMACVYWYRRYSVHYTLTSQRLIHESGLLWRTIDRVELIDIDDVTYRQGPVERALGVGTILVSSSDTTTPELVMPGIDNVRVVADDIDDARRKERRSRGLHIESV